MPAVVFKTHPNYRRHFGFLLYTVGFMLLPMWASDTYPTWHHLPIILWVIGSYLIYMLCEDRIELDDKSFTRTLRFADQLKLHTPLTLPLQSITTAEVFYLFDIANFTRKHLLILTKKGGERIVIRLVLYGNAKELIAQIMQRIPCNPTPSTTDIYGLLYPYGKRTVYLNIAAGLLILITIGLRFCFFDRYNTAQDHFTPQQLYLIPTLMLVLYPWIAHEKKGRRFSNTFNASVLLGFALILALNTLWCLTIG